MNHNLNLVPTAVCNSKELLDRLINRELLDRLINWELLDRLIKSGAS